MTVDDSTHSNALIEQIRTTGNELSGQSVYFTQRLLGDHASRDLRELIEVVLPSGRNGTALAFGVDRRVPCGIGVKARQYLGDSCEVLFHGVPVCDQ